MFDFMQLYASKMVSYFIIITCVIVSICSIIDTILNGILFSYKKQKDQKTQKSTICSKLAAFFTGKESSGPETIDEISPRANMSPDVDLVEWERLIALEHAKNNLMSHEELNNVRPDIAEEFLYNLDGKRTESLDTYGSDNISANDAASIDAMNKLKSVIDKASRKVVDDAVAAQDSSENMQRRL